MNAEEQNNNNFNYNIIQFIIFCSMMLLLFFRILGFKSPKNNSIWIINYIGMGIALINLFINKCIELHKISSKKYKPFVGFTIVVIIIIFIVSIFIYNLQSSQYVSSINDIITLLALFFSLSDNIWSSLLNVIVKIIK